jgi:ABC-2 type transport system permease protein
MSTAELPDELNARRRDPARFRFAPTRSPFSWLLQREVVRYLRIWPNAVVGQLSMPLLMLGVFGYALRHRAGGTGGVPYTHFILPGLIAQCLMTVGWTNGTISIFDARRDRYINDVLASPLRWWEINGACVLAAIIRQILTGGLVAAIAIPIVGEGVHRPLVLVAGLTAIFITASQMGVIAGVYVKTMDQNVSLQTLLVQPLTFLGGTFYSLSTLPAAWRLLSHINPVFYVVQVLRIGFLGHADLPAGTALGVLWGMALLLTIWSLWLFRTGHKLKD